MTTAVAPQTKFSRKVAIKHLDGLVERTIAFPSKNEVNPETRDYIVTKVKDIFQRGEAMLMNPHARADSVEHYVMEMEAYINLLHKIGEKGWAMPYDAIYRGLIAKSPHFE